MGEIIYAEGMRDIMVLPRLFIVSPLNGHPPVRAGLSLHNPNKIPALSSPARVAPQPYVADAFETETKKPHVPR